MSEPVRVDRASLDALTETMRAMSVRVAKLEAENAELRALLTRAKTSLNERVNDPMQDGAEAAE